MAVRTLATVPIRRRGDPCCQNVAPPSLTNQQTTRAADRFKAAGDSTRLRILDLLVQQSEPICVCDITPLFDQLQPTISHHLRLLREAGLIDTEKRGLWSYYWATNDGRTTLEATKHVI